MAKIRLQDLPESSSITRADVGILYDADSESEQTKSYTINVLWNFIETELYKILNPIVWENRTGFGANASSLYLNTSTGYFSIIGTDFPIYISGKSYLKSTESIALNTGTNYVFYDESGTLTVSSSNFSEQAENIVPISNVYFKNSNENIVSDSRYTANLESGIRDTLRKNVGCHIEPGSFAIDYSDNLTIRLTTGTVYDADLEKTITGPIVNHLLMYLEGNNNWRLVKFNDGNVLNPPISTTDPPYYNVNAGTESVPNWGLTAVPNGKYFSTWVAVGNFLDSDYSLLFFTAQNLFDTEENAILYDSFSDVNLGNNDIPNFKLLYQVISKYDTSYTSDDYKTQIKKIVDCRSGNQIQDRFQKNNESISDIIINIPKRILVAADPTSSTAYPEFSIWINSATTNVFICVNQSAGTWIQIG